MGFNLLIPEKINLSGNAIKKKNKQFIKFLFSKSGLSHSSKPYFGVRGFHESKDKFSS